MPSKLHKPETDICSNPISQSHPILEKKNSYHTFFLKKKLGTAETSHQASEKKNTKHTQTQINTKTHKKKNLFLPTKGMFRQTSVPSQNGRTAAIISPNGRQVNVQKSTSSWQSGPPVRRTSVFSTRMSRTGSEQING